MINFGLIDALCPCLPSEARPPIALHLLFYNDLAVRLITIIIAVMGKATRMIFEPFGESESLTPNHAPPILPKARHPPVNH